MGPRGRQPFLYATVAAVWAQALSEAVIDVRRYWEAWERPGWNVVDDFLADLDVPAEALNLTGIDRNASLNADSAAYMIAANAMRKDGRLPASVGFIDLVHRRIKQRFPKGAPARPSVTRARAFYKSFSEDNARLAERHFGGKTVFSDDFSMYPAHDTVLEGRVDPAILAALLQEAFADFLGETLPSAETRSG
jgi:hypothetical protein